MPYADPEKSKAYRKAWRKANKEHVHSYNKEHAEIRAGHTAAWKRKHPDLVIKQRLLDSSRRAKKRDEAKAASDFMQTLAVGSITKENQA